MSNLKAYHLFVRIDASNRPVDGSNKLLKTAPKQGKWTEVKSISGNVCCDYTTLNATPNDVSNTDFTLTILCGERTLFVVNIEGTTTTVQGIVDLLNDQASFLGVFSVNADETSIDLKISAAISIVLCSDTLSFTVTAVG